MNEESDLRLIENTNQEENASAAQSVIEGNEFGIRWKRIPLEEHMDSMNLNSTNEQHQNTIRRLEKLIQAKEAQLENLQKAYQSEKNKFIDVSHLSTVGFLVKLSTQYDSAILRFVSFWEQHEVINCLVNGIKGKSYPENVRIFSMNIQYYSTAAYKALRLFFSKHLPDIRTLQMWYKSVDGSPGISKSALDILCEKASTYLAEHDHPLHVTLSSDETSIRKDLCYCNESQTFVGFSTVTNESEHNDDTSQLKLAKDALVFIAVGPDFKIPVSYEFLNGLETTSRAALTLRVIESIEETGTRVISLTTDALAANITTAEELGAKFSEGKPYFMSPTYPEQKIYFILDPPHMLKLIRKHFCSDEIYHNDQVIDWELLKILVDKQSKENFNLCNKLTKNHINWHQKPMNVRLAAETISRSVANVLDQLRIDGYDDFKNSEATAAFLRFFNDAFDILNFGQNRKPDGRFKQKLCANTASQIFEFAEKFKQYIRELELRKPTKTTPILMSSAEKGFFGFYIDFISLRGIYDDLIVNGPLTEFYPFQFSQDHLETFFSLIRYDSACNPM